MKTESFIKADDKYIITDIVGQPSGKRLEGTDMKINICQKCRGYSSHMCKGRKDVKRAEDCDGFRELNGIVIPLPLDMDTIHQLRKMRRKINGEESEDNLRENIAILFRDCLDFEEMRKYSSDFEYNGTNEKFYLR